MTTLGVIALVTWLVGGLVVGITAEVRYCAGVPWPIHDGPATRGFRVLAGWMLAPIVVSAALVSGVCWVLGHAVGRVERARPTREALEQRIRELEDETGVGR